MNRKLDIALLWKGIEVEFRKKNKIENNKMAVKMAGELITRVQNLKSKMKGPFEKLEAENDNIKEK